MLGRFANLAYHLLRDAAWAPISVILLRGLAMVFGIRAQLDHVIHFSGGFAIAYFLFRAIKMAHSIIGPVTPITRYLFAFCAACTVALFWEFGELASDIFTDTHIQHSVSETLYDLLYGTAGATCSLVMNSLIQRMRNNTAEQGAAANP